MKLPKKYGLGILVIGLILLSIVATSTFAKKNGSTPGPSEGGIPPMAPVKGMEEICAKVPPDAEYFIPESFKEKKVASGSGWYGYRSATKCPLWVVDFSMNSKSNTYVSPDSGKRFKEETVFSGDAYDLPSSAAKFGNAPIVEEDCKRFKGRYFTYFKMKHEPTFKFIKTVTYHGSWAGHSNKCDVVFSEGGAKFTAPDANVLVIRVAVDVLLRSSFQEAAAIAKDGTPD